MKVREFTGFDIKMVNTMVALYNNNAIIDDVMDNLRDLQMEYNSLLLKNKILSEKLNIDSKTNLLVYRDDYLSLILKSASRVVAKVPEGAFNIAYIRFDIDDFSSVNNRFGHDNGDRVLVDLATLLKENSRPTDYVIRYGGEEFDVILPATDISGAETYLNKIYNNMSAMDYTFGNRSMKVSASAGVSIFSMPYDDLKKININKIKGRYMALQKYADDALYEAKISGKNQYKVYRHNVDYEEIREKYTEMKLKPAS